jgi:hypothetical protein
MSKPAPRPTEASSLDLVLKRNSVERLNREKSPLGMLDELPTLIAAGYEQVPEEDIVAHKWWGLVVSTSGGSPALAQRIHDDIADLQCLRQGAIARLLKELRPQARREFETAAGAREFVQRLIREART